MQTRIMVVLVLAIFSFAFHFGADSEPNPFRKRFQPGWIYVSEDWNPPTLRFGKPRVIENRVMRPRMKVPVSFSDTYLFRLFYILDGVSPVTVRFSGIKVGNLVPTQKWKQANFSTPFIQKNTKLDLDFDLSSGSRLSIRRVDYRNYLFRIGSFFTVKPVGGSRVPYNVLWIIFTMVGMISVGGLTKVTSRKRTENSKKILWMILPVGLLGLVLIFIPKIFGVSIHSHPAFLSMVFITLSTGGLLPKIPGGWNIMMWRLVIGTVSIILSLILLEGALHVWDPPISRPRLRSYAKYSPVYGWVNRPGVEGWQVDIRYHIRINRHGHRGPDYPVKKPPGIFRILALGDSYTFGWGVEEDQTFMNVLKQRLQEKGYKVEIVNAGVPAWHSVQSLHYLRAEGIKFQPDLVVMNFFMDDVFFDTLENRRVRHDALEMRAEEIQIAKYRSGTARNFRLYNLWFNYRKIQRASKDYQRRNPYPNFESERTMIRKDFDKDLKLMSGLKEMVADWDKTRKELGIPIIFSYIPPGGAIKSPDYQGHARALQKMSLSLGIPYLNVMSLFDDYPEPRTLYLHPRDTHMSAIGHTLMGEALSEFILKGKWIKK